MESLFDKDMHKILIIGAGYVGKATGIGLSKKVGADVTFVDISETVINELRKMNFKALHRDMISEISRDRYDFIFICLPTPYNSKYNLQDMSIVESSVDLISRIIKEKTTVILRSTVLPGTSRLILNSLERITGMEDGKDFYFCTNPEFLRARSALNDFMNPWIIVIGSNNDNSPKNLISLYQNFIDKDRIHLVNLEEAEFIKYTHNIYNSTKISFSNQIWLLTRQFGIDGNKIMKIVAESAEGSWNKHYGIRGGTPYSGLCLPKDTKGFLTWLKSHGISAPIIEATDTINEIIKLNSIEMKE